MRVNMGLADVQAFCRRREVDLVLGRADPAHELRLHAELDGYGDFFSILANDVAFMELPASFTVGGLELTTNAASFAPKWAHIPRLYPGQALVMCTADAGAFEGAAPEDLFILVADEIAFVRGDDWA